MGSIESRPTCHVSKRLSRTLQTVVNCLGMGFSINLLSKRVTNSGTRIRKCGFNKKLAGPTIY